MTTAIQLTCIATKTIEGLGVVLSEHINLVDLSVHFHVNTILDDTTASSLFIVDRGGNMKYHQTRLGMDVGKFSYNSKGHIKFVFISPFTYSKNGASGTLTEITSKHSWKELTEAQMDVVEFLLVNFPNSFSNKR